MICSRHVAMGLWTGLLAGVGTALVGPLLDVTTGGGLDASAALAGRLGLAPAGAAARLLAAVGAALLLSVVLGLVLALVPLRLAGPGAGLLLGAAAGLGLVWWAGPPPLSTAAAVLFLTAGCAGVLAGFLYSRYARTRLRPAGIRPFVGR